jgi:hypothetical protein
VSCRSNLSCSNPFLVCLSVCRCDNQCIAMANAVVASWTACVRELEQLLDTADAAEADVSKLFQRADKLGEQLSLPHAAWKKLVHDVQVTHASIDVTLSLCLGGKHRCQASRGAERTLEGLWKHVPPEISDVQPAHGARACTARMSLAYSMARWPGLTSGLHVCPFPALLLLLHADHCQVGSAVCPGPAAARSTRVCAAPDVCCAHCMVGQSCGRH